MAESVVDRESVETFIQDCGETNFEIIARGVNTSGAVQPTIQKRTKYFGDQPKTDIQRWYNGLRTSIAPDGLTRVFSQAVNLAEGGDWYRAIVALVECGYYEQVELRPTASMSVQDRGEQDNPLAAILQPLIWRCENNGSVTTHGGARAGAGRPSLQGRLISIDMPEEMIAQLNANAKAQGISRAEVIRNIIAKELELNS